MPGVFKAQLHGVMNEGKARPKRSPTTREHFTGFLSFSPQPRAVDTVSENHLQMRSLRRFPGPSGSATPATPERADLLHRSP